jgi:hypothetical protein
MPDCQTARLPAARTVRMFTAMYNSYVATGTHSFCMALWRYIHTHPHLQTYLISIRPSTISLEPHPVCVRVSVCVCVCVCVSHDVWSVGCERSEVGQMCGAETDLFLFEVYIAYIKLIYRIKLFLNRYIVGIMNKYWYCGLFR